MVDYMNRLQPPTLSHLLGTDFLGRDVLSRIIFSFRVDMYIGLFGFLLGTLAAWILVLGRPARGIAGTVGDLPPILRGTFLGFAGVTLVVGFFGSSMLIEFLGEGYLNVVISAGVFSAILPMALVYESVRGTFTLSYTGRAIPASTPIKFSIRREIALAPVSFSLAMLMGFFIELYLSFIGWRLPHQIPCPGTLLAEAGLGGSSLGLIFFESAVIAIAIGAFLGISIQISQMQNSARTNVHDDVGIAMNAPKAVKALIGIFVFQIIWILSAIVVFYLLAFTVPEGEFARNFFTGMLERAGFDPGEFGSTEAVGVTVYFSVSVMYSVFMLLLIRMRWLWPIRLLTIFVLLSALGSAVPLILAIVACILAFRKSTTQYFKGEEEKSTNERDDNGDRDKDSIWDIPAQNPLLRRQVRLERFLMHFLRVLGVFIMLLFISSAFQTYSGYEGFDPEFLGAMLVKGIIFGVPGLLLYRWSNRHLQEMGPRRLGSGHFHDKN